MKPSANQILLIPSATDLLSVVVMGESHIEVTVRPGINLALCELWAVSEKTGKYASWCDGGRYRCIIYNLRPGINYTVTLAHCYGTRPNRCDARSKQLAVSLKPRCTLFIPSTKRKRNAFI